MEKDKMELGQKKFIVVQLLLRFMAALFALAAALVMAINKQTTDLAGYQITAAYTMSPDLKFFVAGNVVSSSYSLLSMPFVSTLANGFLLYLLDLLSLILMMATASIGTAAGFLAKEGNDKIGWTEVCSYFHRFCSRAESSVAFSFIGLLLFLLICTISHAYALKNKQQENLQQSPSP